MSEKTQPLAQRQEKADSLASLGVNLYSNTFSPQNSIETLLPLNDSLEAQETDPKENVYSIAGRIMTMRKFGKAAFCTIKDMSGQIQIYLKKDILGDAVFETFKKWDLGDIVGIEGVLFKTKVGELSLQARSIVMISKSMRPLPDKWHGLNILSRNRRYLLTV